MHLNNFNLYFFINTLDKSLLNKIPKKTSIIYRNYSKKICKKEIIEIKNFCKKIKLRFYLSNNIKLAIQLKLDGVYIPSFNKSLNLENFRNYRKDFTVLGSAHNIAEIKLKEKQGVDIIFLSPLFLTKNYRFCLNVVRFNLMAQRTKNPLIALGGIKKTNQNNLKIVNAIGLSGISYFKSYI